jgi:hypothetical protein
MSTMHKAMYAEQPTGIPDVDFARLMIPHHQGAIDMAGRTSVRNGCPLAPVSPGDHRGTAVRNSADADDSASFKRNRTKAKEPKAGVPNEKVIHIWVKSGVLLDQ